VSNSLLSGILNPKLFWLKRNKPELFEDEEDTHYRIGSAVDCLLTSPQDWDTTFVVGDVYKPFGLMGKFVKHLPKGLNADSPNEDYAEAYEKAGYKKSLDWVVTQFKANEKHVDYYLWLTALDDTKVGLSKDEHTQVTKAVETIKSNRFANSYFYASGPDVEVLHQLQIFFEYEGLECKSLLDGVRINHTNKTIEPYDLKTTGKSVWEFPQSYLHFGYYRQCAFYELALHSESSPLRRYIDEGYEVLDFVFIVVESKPDMYGPALIFRTSPSQRVMGIEGAKVGQRYYPGINDLIEAYKWHTATDYWELPKDVYNNNGIVQLQYG
jgi:hypothetical protein